VVGVSESAAVKATYLAVVASIAPDSLAGRELELKNLVDFCAGNEFYQWIQAPAWSGKTALTSWFSLHPPAGVQVVSFFITSRLAGQADADGFAHAIIDQLMALIGKVEDVNLGKGPLTGQLLYLLESATVYLRNRSERLLLVVDGLDEDQGRNPSIAALLPRRPLDGMRILVSSRPHPGLPDDVPGDHPLRSCRTLELSPFPHARYQEIESIRELNERLFADTRQRDIIALIAVSGGGLSARDLGELTERPRFEVAHQLNSYFGRSLSLRASPFGEATYLLAHETLQATAEEVLDADIAPYRERIHAWAERYKADDWPTSTPGYLLERYGRLLAAVHDRDRLVALACDSKRHEQMMRHTRSDFAAIAEIAAAQQELKSSRHDLTSLTLIAIERERVANRGAVCFYRRS
jgi:hypothetical protein